jgi:hypothetical protein
MSAKQAPLTHKKKHFDNLRIDLVSKTVFRPLLI